ncbi:hypothetical protein GQ600_20136 [Phytophthora cactorum]|nr:hypothetical protein GQ600_20136 [Phytophthora cactorum]
MTRNDVVDQDGDIVMKITQAVFEYIKPPRLTDLGQPALLVVANFLSDVLRVDIERLVAVTHQQAKHDDVALYVLIVRRAKTQQHFHTMQSEMKRSDAPKDKPAGQSKRGGA